MTTITADAIEVIEMVMSWGITTFLVFFVILRDERKMNEAYLERAWLPATRSLAIVVFTLFALPIHFTKTRRSILGFLQGMGWAVAVIVVNTLVMELIDLGIGLIVGDH